MKAYNILSVKVFSVIIGISLVCSSLFGQLKVVTMPSYQYCRQWGNTVEGDTVTVWGAVLGDVITNYNIVFKMNGVEIHTALPGTITDPYIIPATPPAYVTTLFPGTVYYAANHYIGYKCKFTTPGSQKIVMEVWNTAKTVKLDSSISFIKVFPNTLPQSDSARVNMLIENGLLYLFKNAVSNTTTTVLWTSNLITQPIIYTAIAFNSAASYGLTGISLYAFESQNHYYSNNLISDPYSDLVSKGLQYLFADLGKSAIANHQDGKHGTPVSDITGSGFGLGCANINYPNFSFCLLSFIMANYNTSQTFNVVNTLSGNFSYNNIIRNNLDQIYWGQGDSTSISNNYRGAWYYNLSPQSSNPYSGFVEQWPTLSMIMADRRLGIKTPQWIKYNIAHAYDTILQNHVKGGCGLNDSNCVVNSNIDIAKTSGMLGSYAWLSQSGINLTTPINQAMTYINANYNNWSSGTACSNGWAGSLNAMYGLKRGLSFQNGYKLTPYAGLNFYTDMAWWLSGGKVFTSNPPALIAPVKNTANCYGPKLDGSWTDNDIFKDNILSTAFAVLILSPEKYQFIKNSNIANVTICQGHTTQLSLAVTGATYEWSPTKGLNIPNIINPIAESDTSTTYIGYAYDSNHLPIADTIIHVIVNTCNGFNDLSSLNSTVKIVPNPSNGIFTIVIDNPVKEKVTIEINDINGQRVFIKDILHSMHCSELIDLSSLQKGVYFVHVKSSSFSKIEKLLVL